MLNPFQVVKKVGKFIRGGVGTPQILLGCLLGLGIGMTVGFNALTAILIVLLILLNASGFLAALCIVLGKVLSLALAPVTFRMGYVIIHKIGLEGLFRAMSDTPVVAFMNMHNYCQVGNLVIAIVLGLGMGLYLARMARGVRRKLGAIFDAHDRVQRVVGNPVTRLFTWLLFGKAKGTMKELAEKSKFPLFRKGGVILAVIVVGLVVAAQVLLANMQLASTVADAAGQQVGAEVNIEDVDLGLFNGNVTITGLQVTDPEKPTHNAFQAETLSGQLSMRDLLTGRFTLDTVEIIDVRTDVERETPGQVYEKPEEEEELPDDLLTDYFANWEEYREYLQQAKKAYDWLKENRGESEPEEAEEPAGPTLDDMLAQARRDGYHSLSAQAILTRKPTWTIRNLKVEKIRPAGDPDVYHLSGVEVTSHPSLTGQPMTMTISSESEKAIQGELVLDYTAPGTSHRLKLSIPDVDVSGLLGGKSVVQVSQGTASLNVDGEFTADNINLPVKIVAKDLALSPAEGKSVLGMQSGSASELLKNVNEITLPVTIIGSVYAPRLKVDEAAAREAVTEAAGSVAKKLLQDQLKQNNINLPSGAGGMLDGLQKKDDDEQDGTKDDEKKPNPLGGLLEGLNR